MKLWKKIVLIVSTLIVVISTMVLPIFADSYYPNTKLTQPYGPKYSVALWREKSNVMQYYEVETQGALITEDIQEKRSQSWQGRLTASLMRNGVVTETLSQYSIRYLSTWHSEYTGYIGGQRLRIKLNDDNGTNALTGSTIKLEVKDYIYHNAIDAFRLRVGMVAPPEYNENPYQIYMNVTATVAVPIINYESNSVTFRDETLGYGRLLASDLMNSSSTVMFDILPNDMINIDDFKPRIINEGEEVVLTKSPYYYLKDIKVEFTRDDGNELKLYDFTLNLPCNDTEMILGNYSNVLRPDNYTGYMSYLMTGQVEDNRVTVGSNSFWSFIETSIGGFFNFELAPHISIGAIIMTVIGVMLFIIILKIFAGG